MTTQLFADSENTELGLEVYLYDMGNAKNAFSVYSRQKRADGTDLPNMPFAYKTGNSVYMSHGKYYLEIIGFAQSQELIARMEDILEKLAGEITVGDDDKIEALAFFPAGTVAGSWKLQLTDAFGFDGLTDTYSALYSMDEAEVTIFFNRQNNTAESQAVAKSYSDFLITNGAKVISTDSASLKSANASVLDFYDSTEIIFAAGVFVGGVHEAEDRIAAQKAAEILLSRLGEIGGASD